MTVIATKRKIQTLPLEMKQAMAAEKWYLHNISEEVWTANRSYGFYLIPAKQPNERYASLTVPTAVTMTDIGDDTCIEGIERAENIAKDLEASINGNVGDGGFQSFNGVFASANELPTEGELSAAERRLTEFYTRMVSEGNKAWEGRRRMEFISGLMLRAAKHLKIDAEWCSVVRPQTECPGCGEMVKPNIAVCRTCGAVLDREKALSLGLIREEAPASDPEPSSRKREHKAA